MTNRKSETKNNVEYGYYSRVLKEPFDSIEELAEAEEAYFAKQKAKADAAAVKKADALKVEEAFKEMNRARKSYKHDMQMLTNNYCADLRKLKESLEKEKANVNKYLEEAQNTYETALKAFTQKYPEGFHLTLHGDDGEELTISSESEKKAASDTEAAEVVANLFNLLFSAI